MGILDKVNNTPVPPPPRKEPIENMEFWYCQYNENPDSADYGKLKGFKLVHREMHKLVRALGYSYMETSPGIKQFVHKSRNIVRIIEREEIAQAFMVHVMGRKDPLDGNGLYRDAVIETLIKGISGYFAEDKLKLITDASPGFVKSTRDTAWMFFENTAVKITTKEIKAVKYEDLPGYVWQDQILKRNFTQKVDYKQGYFYKFMHLVSSKDDQRTKALMEITGYLLHNDRENKRKAIVLTDGHNIIGSANGRTGKSLYGKCFAHALCREVSNGKVVVTVNGMDFDPRDKFKWQVLSPMTQIVSLNDLKRNFPIDALFNDIADGMSVQQKQMAPFTILPNMLLTTNQTLRLKGGSALDRVCEFDFAPYFNAEYQPYDEFKTWFWDPTWKDSDWAQFDFLMVECLRTWLAAGKLPVVAPLAKERRLSEATDPDFMDWWKEKLEKGDLVTCAAIETKDIPQSAWHNRNEWLDDFKTNFPDHVKQLTVKTFQRWIETVLEGSPEFSPFDAELDKRRSSGIHYIRLRPAPETKPKDAKK